LRQRTAKQGKRIKKSRSNKTGGTPGEYYGTAPSKGTPQGSNSKKGGCRKGERFAGGTSSSAAGGPTGENWGGGGKGTKKRKEGLRGTEEGPHYSIDHINRGGEQKGLFNNQGG